MTFKSAQKTFLRKKKFYESKNQTQNNLTTLFTDFLKNNYPENIVAKLEFNLDYIPQKDRLIIQTNSKAFSNDLILKLGKLNHFLANSEIKEIVIK